MAEAETDIAALNDSQQESLQQYVSVTGQEIEQAIPLLRRSEWNVQIAIAKFFDGETAIPDAGAAEPYIPPPQQARHQETLMNGFTSSSASSRRSSMDIAPRIVPQSESQIYFQAPLILKIILAPISFLYTITKTLLSPFAILFPWLAPRPVGGVTINGGRIQSPKETATQLAHDFTEEYGPNDFPFFLDGYAQAQDAAKRDLKFLLVILISKEHPDTSSFVRETMLSRQVLQLVNDAASNLLVWVGDVQQSEGYEVSTSLGCTKLPFSALITLTPGSSTRLRLAVRIVGPKPPEEYVQYIQDAMRRHGDPLASMKEMRAARQAERSYQDKQEEAYQRSLEIDKERARQRREKEAAEQARARKEEEQSRMQEQRSAQRRQWRRWRAGKLKAEPETSHKGVVRISVRMPWGERVVRRFDGAEPVEELYAFVDCRQLAAGEVQLDGDGEPEGYKHEYGFVLVSPLPRTVYSADEAGSIGERVGRSGNLIVEALDDDDPEWQQAS